MLCQPSPIVSDPVQPAGSTATSSKESITLTSLSYRIGSS